METNSKPYNLKSFTILDTKAGLYMAPYFASNEALGIRTFKDLLNNPQSILAKHPEDFALYYNGEYNSQTAELTNGKLTHVCTALELQQIN
ncbi:MAG: nonstructural protein [Arizlama microvirus]|nr:MAG: nonstructural protein [Arizlama microvirus]